MAAPTAHHDQITSMGLAEVDPLDEFSSVIITNIKYSHYTRCVNILLGCIGMQGSRWVFCNRQEFTKTSKGYVCLIRGNELLLNLSCLLAKYLIMV